jgi:hypothetical protein
MSHGPSSHVHREQAEYPGWTGDADMRIKDTRLKGVRVAVAIAACLVSSVAVGGYRVAFNVFLGSTYADGNVGAARYSSDSNQEIGCYAQGSPGSVYAGCYAADSSGNYASCVTGDPAFVATVGRINATSFIWFEYNSSGQCTYLTVDNDSSYIY